MPNPPFYFPNSGAGKVDGMETIPNQLSHEAIEEFRKIYEEEFGVRLSDAEVQEIALRLLRFFGILTEPSPDKSPDLGTHHQ